MKQPLFFLTLLLHGVYACAYNAAVPYHELPPPEKPAVQAGDFLILENPSDSGMFAVFSSVLGALNLYEQGNFAGLKIDLNSGRYLDLSQGTNWWEYFFEPIELGHQQASIHHFTLAEYMHLALIDSPQNRDHAFHLIQKYIHVKPSLQEEIEHFATRFFSGHFMIGVHHRGTDKSDEVSIVPYEKTVATLRKVIKHLPKSTKKTAHLFVATDDLQFLTYLIEQFPNRVIYSDIPRSMDGTALHAYMTNLYPTPYEMGKGAVLDCILLSKCAILVRPGSSGLSRISSCFNPQMRVINLDGKD